MRKKPLALSTLVLLSALSCRTSPSDSGLKEETLPTQTPSAPGSSAPAAPAPTTTSFDPYANLDARLGEKLADKEIPITDMLTGAIQGSVAKKAAEGGVDEKGQPKFVRDAHPKAHGCVKADFTILKNIPADMQTGLFAKSGKSYKAWIRYSNGNPAIQTDTKPDGRGMAVKVTGVEGTKIESSLPEQTTQDFVMINNPIFFVDDPATYLKFLGGGPAALPPANLALLMKVVSSQPRNPLREAYWSEVPYRLGTGDKALATKFAAIPVSCKSMKLPADQAAQQKYIAGIQAENRVTAEAAAKLDANYLRKNLITHLKDNNSCFIFGIQRAIDDVKTPVENSGVNWDESAAFVPVAEIRIAKQVFASDAQDNFCQNLSMSPWHALPEHKPMGTPNRIRLKVYKAISELRRKGNKAPEADFTGPTGNETF